MRTYVAVLFAVACLGLSACGSDSASHDVVPSSVPALTPPPGATALAQTSTGASSTSTDTTSTDATGTTPLTTDRAIPTRDLGILTTSGAASTTPGGAVSVPFTLRYAGAAYLVWFGVRLLVRAVRGAVDAEPVRVAGSSPWRAARQGLTTNLLNPKVGVFYVALLPQFLPAGSDPLAVGLLLAGVHGLITTAWFTLLIALAAALGARLRRPGTVRAVDGVTGTTLVGFGVRLAVSR